MTALASLFAGIGGFDLAAKQVGMTPAVACEIEQRASSVLETHFPDADWWGDVADMGGNPGHIDVITAGSPCQDFSIAGLRKGLAGSRSGLFEHVIRLRDELKPRFVVWENVPGALTSNKGEDFANVLGALVGSDVPLPLPKHPNGRRSRYAGIAHGPAGTLAWRVLDAQHFGVPQRRQRIFAVLDTQGWASIDILFPGYTTVWDTPRRSWVIRGSAWAAPLDYDDMPFDTGMAPISAKTRLADILKPDVDERYYLSEKACKGILRRAEKRGRTLPEILDYALRCQAGEVVGEAPKYETPEVVSTLQGGGERGYRIGAEDAAGGHLVPEIAPALTARYSKGTDSDASDASDALIPVALSQNSRDEVRVSDVAPALSGGGGKPGQGYSAVLEPVPINGSCVHDGPARMGAFTKGTGIGEAGDPSPTVHGSTVHAVAHAVNARQDPIVGEDLLAGPLDTDGTTHAVCSPPLYRVRRLTPVECERLQGFPDGWTDIEGAKDSHRYRQLGNAVAVPVATWVLDRIQEVLTCRV